MFSTAMRLWMHLTPDHSDLLPVEIAKMERDIREELCMPPYGSRMTAADVKKAFFRAAWRQLASLSAFADDPDRTDESFFFFD